MDDTSTAPPQRWSLVFRDEALEEEFQQKQSRAAVPSFRLLAALQVPLWASFSAIDLRVAGDPANLRTILWLRFALGMPLLLLNVLLSRTKPPTFQRLRPVGALVMAFVFLLLPMVMGFAVPHPGAMDTQSMTSVGTGGFVIFGVVSTLWGIRFEWLALGALPAYACTTSVYLFAYAGRTWSLQLGGASVVAFGGVLTAYLLDQARRSAFVAERALARERARTESLLRQEVGHQVAERSRVLGQVLSQVDGALVVQGPAVGARFDGRYRIRRRLGAGGMGEVFEVDRITDGERLALKVITGHVTGAQAARFAREAEIGARLRHPHLVAIVDVGVASGIPFLVMELAAGGSLEEQRARFGAPRWARPILRDIAAGLAALHAAGVVHRDLKPANVLFVDRAEATSLAVISDFGISRFGADTDLEGPDLALVATLDASSPKPSAGRLTGTGNILGTPAYMPPESAAGGRDVGPPGDVFTFALLAWEMLTGAPAFEVPPLFVAMAGQRLSVPEDVLDRSLEPGLRALLVAALSHDPTARPTILALRDALASSG